VRIIVIMEVVWTLLATLLSLYLVLFGVFTAPASVIWCNVVIFAAFFIAWTYFYGKYRR
jgi:1,4-dihydroxy-2-naphthoate octaprenyltransferase